MSTLSILGGIGQGIMAGQQHIAQQSQMAAQQRNWDTQNRFNNARLGALNDEMKTRRAERERVDNLARVYQQYGDKDWTDPATFEAMTRDSLPYMSAQDIATVQQQSAAVRDAAGVDAVNRFLYANDLSGFQRTLDQKMPGARLTNEGGMLRITQPDGTQQDFTDAKGFAALLGMGVSLERLQAHEASRTKGDQERRAGEAKIDLDRAKAEEARSKARTAAAGGKGSAGSTDANDVPQFAPSDYQHIVRLLPASPDSGEADPLALSSVLADAQSIMQANPSFRGSKEQALNIAVRLQLPDEHPQKLRAGPLYDAARMAWFKGVKTEDGDVYLGATTRPVDAYAQAGEAGRALNYELDTEAIAAEAERMPPEMMAVLGPYINGTKPLGQIRADEAIPPQLREKAEMFVLATRRVNQHAPRATARPSERGGNESGARHSAEAAPQNDPLAAALGVVPDNRGVVEQIVSDAKTVGGGLMEGAASVGSMLLGADDYRKAWRVDQELENFRRAKASGNAALTRFYAERLYALGKGSEDLSARILREISQDQ